jgi:hypothetical protein
MNLTPIKNGKNLMRNNCLTFSLFSKKKVSTTLMEHRYCRITRKFNKQLKDGSSYGSGQISRKIRKFKELHRDYTHLKNQQHGTGYGWDDDMQMVVLSEDQWEHFRVV